MIYQVQGRGTHAYLIDHRHVQSLVGVLLDTLCVSQEGIGIISVIENVLLFDNNTKSQISNPSYNHRLMYNT
jgi:hypothetical protein